MFKEIPNGTMVQVQGLDCWIPPLGWGCHTDTGELARVDTIKRSHIASEQYWEPQTLPAGWEDKYYKEQLAAEEDPNHSDPDLDKIRSREWHRRLYGVWIYVNGKPIYLTGINYFFLNYWFLDTGLPDFRIIDVEYFYFWQYNVEDPKSYGIDEVRKRRDGKTKRAACILYEYASRCKRVWCGIQSMNSTAAQEIFTGDIITAFKTLPEFFVPTYDTAQGDAPKTELRFFRTVQKGKRKLGDSKKPELQSKIDFKDSKAKAYDGKKVQRLLLDESGKVEVDVIDRHLIVKPCLLDNQLNIIGKMIVTSTVEEMGLKFRFKDLWLQSNQYHREKDGTTKSGLSRFFIGADRAGRYDKYGEPYVKENYDEVINERSKQQTQADLIKQIRKFPLTESEAFKTADSECVYNWFKLSAQQDAIEWKHNLRERGNFVWNDPENLALGVKWEASRNGRFEIAYLLKQGEHNKVSRSGAQFIPNNNHSFRIGVDPFKYRNVDDSRRSDCAAYVYQMFDVVSELKQYNDSFVCEYKYRAATPGMQYDDILKMCWYYGCQALFEVNIGMDPISYFTFKECYHFCFKLPGEKDPGIKTDGHGQVIEQICALTETYIENSIENVIFPNLIQDWLDFDPNNTRQFDCAMAAGFALIAAKKKFRGRGEKDNKKEITNYIRQYSTI